jgi:hypothetical protein
MNIRHHLTIKGRSQAAQLLVNQAAGLYTSVRLYQCKTFNKSVILYQVKQEPAFTRYFEPSFHHTEKLPEWLQFQLALTPEIGKSQLSHSTARLTSRQAVVPPPEREMKNFFKT